MKIMHDKGFTEKELKDMRSVVQGNIFKSARALAESCRTMEIPIEEPDNQERAKRLLEYEEDDVLSIQQTWTEELATDIGILWKDEGIQKAYMRRNEFQLDDSTGYYMNDIERIAKPSYLPTHEDVLRSRLKTTGIIEVQCVLGNKKISLVDVGGQRNERKKWINCFSDADALM
jgi:hypothetical protein